MADAKQTFTIYRLRDAEGCLTDLHQRGYHDITLKAGYESYSLLVKEGAPRPPRWVRIFTDVAAHATELENLMNMTGSFVVLISTESNVYACAGGIGSFDVRRYAEEQFGLEIATRVLPPDRLRDMRTKHLAGRTEQEEVVFRGYYNYEFDSAKWEKLVKELIGELGKDEVQEALGLDIETRRAIRIQAREACFSVRKALTFNQLQQLAQAFDRALERDPLFSILRGYEEIKGGEVKKELFVQLFEEMERQYTAFINNQDEWTEINIGISNSDAKQLLLCEHYYIYLGERRIAEVDDLDIWTLFKAIKDAGKTQIQISFLTSLRIIGVDDEGNNLFEETLKRVIFAEISREDEEYAFVDGKVFLVSSDFRTSVDERLNQIVAESQQNLAAYLLPCWPIISGKLKTEPEYIDEACLSPGLAKLHGQHVIIKASDKSEVCDIYDERGLPQRLVYLKRGFGARLRELIAQATFCAELFTSDTPFQEGSTAKVNEASGQTVTPTDFVKFPMVLAVVDFSRLRFGQPLSEKLTTAVKLDIIKAYDRVRNELNWPGFYIYEIGHCVADDN
jgi:uncharacterized protein (TIGR04141 family)